MPKGDKYLGLKNFLNKRNEEMLILTFEEIENIIERKLPKSAYKHPGPWWSNNYDHSQAIAWIDAGYQTDFVTETYNKNIIIFFKVG